MDKYLINPNRCRSYGVRFCDDPTDPSRHLGFFHDELHLPLDMRGTVAGLDSHCPTRQELDECRKFYMSDPNKWDPDTVTFSAQRVCSVQEGQTIISFLPSITSLIDAPFALFVLVVSKAVSKAPFEQLTQDECALTLKQFGGSMETQDRHHSVTPELLAQK